jgi:hypothetical protein
MSSRHLKTFKDGDSTTLSGSLFQGFIALWVKWECLFLDIKLIITDTSSHKWKQNQDVVGGDTKLRIKPFTSSVLIEKRAQVRKGTLSWVHTEIIILSDTDYHPLYSGSSVWSPTGHTPQCPVGIWLLHRRFSKEHGNQTTNEAERSLNWLSKCSSHE